MSDGPDIVIAVKRVAPQELARLVAAPFGDMVKWVVDVERGVIALGGELHADAEALLLEHGSSQSDLWGGNYYPGLGPEDCIEYVSMINVRPGQGNHGMEVLDHSIRERMRALVFDLVGHGEPLP